MGQGGTYKNIKTGTFSQLEQQRQGWHKASVLAEVTRYCRMLSVIPHLFLESRQPVDKQILCSIAKLKFEWCFRVQLDQFFENRTYDLNSINFRPSICINTLRPDVWPNNQLEPLQ
jgi:hypothetical protein